VDYKKGNWCEGLTVYLADYLIKEQQGKAKEYRMAALQKYTDYVKNAKDFPLTEFRTRHSSASEAVGYGKSMMFFHMLRLKLVDNYLLKASVIFIKKTNLNMPLSKTYKTLLKKSLIQISKNSLANGLKKRELQE